MYRNWNIIYVVHSISFHTFFCTGIYNCRWLLKIHYVIAIHLMRWLTNFYDFRFKWIATAAIGIHPTKAWLSQLGNFKNAICILVTDYLTKWGIKTVRHPPIVHTLLPVTFGYSLSPEAVLMRQLRWKKLWRRPLTRSHKTTSMGLSRSCWNGTSVLQPKGITSK